jgi:hypothetical protein
MPTPRDPRQAFAQGLLAHQELRQWHPQAKNGGSTQEGRATPDNNDGAGTSFLSAIATTWRLWDEKKVGSAPAYISVSDLPRG